MRHQESGRIVSFGNGPVKRGSAAESVLPGNSGGCPVPIPGSRLRRWRCGGRTIASRRGRHWLLRLSGIGIEQHCEP
jgi:hypothetical protein